MAFGELCSQLFQPGCALVAFQVAAADFDPGLQQKTSHGRHAGSADTGEMNMFPGELHNQITVLTPGISANLTPIRSMVALS